MLQAEYTASPACRVLSRTALLVQDSWLAGWLGGTAADRPFQNRQMSVDVGRKMQWSLVGRQSNELQPALRYCGIEQDRAVKDDGSDGIESEPT